MMDSRVVVKEQLIVGLGVMFALVGCQGAEPPESQGEEAPVVLIEEDMSSSMQPDESGDAEDMNPPSDMAASGEDMSSPDDMTAPGEDMGEPPVAFELPDIVGWEPVEDTNPAPDVVEFTLTAGFTEVDIGAGAPLQMMTYNGSFPGPLIQAKVGDRVIVHFKNDLDQPTTVHWHGLRIPDDMDGSPRVQDPVEPGESFTYDFVVPDAGTYWYHPHVRANEQVEQGLYGPFVIHDPEDPVVDRERVIVVDDVLLDEDGFAPFLESRMEIMHGRQGNALLINGSADVPVAGGEQPAGGVERWRIINTSNARTFSLALEGDASWRVIASDGGLLEQPHETNTIQVAVGQRYDLEVEHAPGASASLTAYILTRNEQGQVVEAPFELYDVEAPEALDSSITEALSWGRTLGLPATSNVEADFVLDAANVFGGVRWTINGKINPADPLYTFTQGDVVTFTIENRLGPEHPFHLHGQFFTILDDGFGRSVPGLKDTVLVPGRRTVKIMAYMDNPGDWMAHCHILEHAELGMMSAIQVDPVE